MKPATARVALSTTSGATAAGLIGCRQRVGSGCRAGDDRPVAWPAAEEHVASDHWWRRHKSNHAAPSMASGAMAVGLVGRLRRAGRGRRNGHDRPPAPPAAEEHAGPKHQWRKRRTNHAAPPMAIGAMAVGLVGRRPRAGRGRRAGHDRPPAPPAAEEHVAPSNRWRRRRINRAAPSTTSGATAAGVAGHRRRVGQERRLGRDPPPAPPIAGEHAVPGDLCRRCRTNRAASPAQVTVWMHNSPRPHRISRATKGPSRSRTCISAMAQWHTAVMALTSCRPAAEASSTPMAS